MTKVTNQTFRHPMKLMAKYVREISFYSSCFLVLAGTFLICYGFQKTLSGSSKYFALIVGGFTLLNALVQLTKSIREEQTKYGYPMVMDWHDMISTLNEGQLFKLNIEQYEKLNDFDKKNIGDDFQRLIDQMSFILWSITFDISVNINDLRDGWIETFRKIFPNTTTANYLWNDKGYKYTISAESRNDLDIIFNVVEMS